MLMEAGLAGIAKVVEVRDYARANEYLDLGWQLLGTHVVDEGHPKERHQATVYCLGWHSAKGEAQEPWGW
ncbi:MAG: hypothetical protein DCC68_21040 [Planctomycetota bacterium]|nr:MAG: hypothetical protein DCC68_21040 [Planctomycetota bacterium]